METFGLAANLKLGSKMEEYPRSQCKITVKDHKETFPGKLSWRLLNPAKSELGRVSQQLLKPIINTLKAIRRANLWVDTRMAINWFRQEFMDQDTKKLSFIQFDIDSYYPNISRELLKKAIDYARQHCDISQEEEDIIFTSRKTFLFNKDRPYEKRNTTSPDNFDVSMGAYDSCEVSELVGLYLLDQFNPVFEENSDWYGFYRDDGLGVLRGTGRVLDKKRKQLEKICKDNGLGITALTNIKVVNFLDVTFDLTSKSYKPYRRPNSKLSYLHVDSDHPSSVIKSVPKTVETRLSTLSSTREIFEAEKTVYEDALKMSGHKVKLEYNPQESKKRVRRRSVTYFNPPFSKSVKTNIGKRFLQLLDKHFPKGTGTKEQKRLQAKIMNRNNVKLSYSTTKNMKKHISAHNKKVLEQKPDNQERLCNCRNKDECPLDGKCLIKSIVYQADVEANNKVMSYYGLTDMTFKERFNSHQFDFRHVKNRNSTALSKYIHSLKETNTNYKIQWKIHTKAYSYTCGARRCDLCLQEKLAICLADPETTLNKRSEMVSKCRHKRKYKLEVSTKPKKKTPWTRGKKSPFFPLKTKYPRASKFCQNAKSS